MDTAAYTTIATAIIQGQIEGVGKPVAYQIAQRATGVSVQADGSISLEGDAQQAIFGLIQEYTKLSGSMGKLLCKLALEELSFSKPNIDIPRAVLDAVS